MRYPAKETAAKHDRIVREASRLFRKRGFENVTVGEVMKAAGVPDKIEGEMKKAVEDYAKKITGNDDGGGEEEATVHGANSPG